MRIGLILAAVSLATVSGSALAAELVDSAFQVSFDYAGTRQMLNDTTVPLLPGNACYTWFVRIDGAGDAPTIIERFELPQPLVDWNAGDDADTQLEDDGKLLVTTLHPTPDKDGWISHGWCVAKGDPVGSHHIELSLDDTGLTGFDFDVVPLDQYSWPAIQQPVPGERSVDNSW